jgi:thiol-disulfide isomerase/thioredoxin
MKTSLLLAACCLAISATAADIAVTSSELYSRAKRQPGDREERIKFNMAIVADGRKCLAEDPRMPKSSPDAEILLRRVILPAAERLYADAPTPENHNQLLKIADEVVRLPVYEGHLIVPEKPRAGYLAAKLAIYPTPDAKPQDAAKHILALIEAFPVRPELKEPDALHGAATVFAAQLAVETGEKALADELCKVVAEQYVSLSPALDVLAQAGQPAVFAGELTTLDGKKVTFPQDVKGKVVLLDFWATWCGPCKASMPHVKELHEKFKDHGVVIIGVSCDTPSGDETTEQNKTKVRDFVTKNDYSWTQTYSGEWPAVATKYGVNKLPTVFLLDQQGRVISATARGREDQLIERALTPQESR